VLRLEARIRRHIAELRSLLDDEEHHLHRVTSATHGVGPWWSWAARRRQRARHDETDTATDVIAALADGYAEAQKLHKALRDHVIGLRFTDGPLADAATGWQRPAGPPAGMVTFDDEAAFLAANPHRATNPDWPDLLSATMFGRSWRRDDDDIPELLDLGGTWQVGHIHATSEIYASRRSPYRPPEVWLLGAGFTLGQACELLLHLEPQMGQPNSLSLVAATVHTPTGTINGS
jgi:hypothetical protein